MKLSVSLPEGDVATLDAYVERHGTTRSAALHEAVRLLRERNLVEQYDEAFREWDGSDDAVAWDGVVADGLDQGAPE